MTNEIKELIDKLKDNDWYEELDLTGTKWIELKQEETNQLLDYITNLQEENKKLKEKLENDIDRYEDTISYQLGFDKGKEYIQQRIDKAVEYIDKIFYVKSGLSPKQATDLLEILRGDE